MDRDEHGQRPTWPGSNGVNLLEAAWGIIANASGGNWQQESPEWQEAAARWRDGYHEWLAVKS